MRGLRALEAADVILTDHLGPTDQLEEFLELAGKEVIDVSKLPYGKQVAQEKTNALIIEHARAGKRVVRLKGGDPYVFGRGFEEYLECAREGIACEVVPGVTSAISVPGAALVPVTHRGITHSFTLVSGHLPPGHAKSLVDWQALARLGGTIVVIMGVKNARAITTGLIEYGLDPRTPATVIENGHTAQQRSFRATVSTLPDVMEEHGVTNPAVYVIGEVAGLAHA